MISDTSRKIIRDGHIIKLQTQQIQESRGQHGKSFAGSDQRPFDKVYHILHNIYTYTKEPRYPVRLM